VEEIAPDVFIVAGDIYDTAVPTARAEELFYDFATKVGEKTLFALISGNHDDPLRLTVASPLAKRHNILLFGESRISVSTENLNADNEGFTYEKNGEKLCVGVLPYPSESMLGMMMGENYEEKVSQKIQEIVTRFEENATNVFVSHLFMASAKDKTSDERELGSARLLNKEILPDCDFVLLGHVHKPMVVSRSKNAYYSGSLMPYSFDDTTDKRMILFDTKDKSLTDVPIMGYKKCVRAKVDDFESAMNILQESKDWVELHYSGEPLTMTQVAQIRRAESCVKMIVESRDLEVKKERKTLSGKEMFIEFYKKEKGAEPREELLNLFTQYFAQAEEENDETNNA
jgi:exonuclease SbcD